MNKILVVDDSTSMRNVITSVLEHEGYKTLEAEDGVQALTIAKKNQFDAVITDVNMPVMGGFKFISELRELSNYKSIPILVLTTENNSESKKRGKEAGANGWVVKPFVPEKLIKAVNSFLN